MSWRWAHDDWDKPDKLGHLIGGAVWVLVLGALWGPWQAFLSGLAFWWAWEVKDAFVRWEDAGWFGGDGFSWKDAVASSAGCALALVAYLIGGAV